MQCGCGRGLHFNMETEGSRLILSFLTGLIAALGLEKKEITRCHRSNNVVSVFDVFAMKKAFP